MKLYSLLLIVIVAISISCKEEKSTEVKAEQGETIFQKLTAMIADNPVNPTLRYQRAKLLYEAERYDEAIEDMRIAILRDSMNTQYYHLLSDLFMDSNNSSRALMTMKKAGELFPDSVNTQLKLAETQYILKQYGESLFTLNGILRTQPQNAEAYFMLGLMFRETKEEAKAIMALQAATEFDANLVDAWILLGNIYEAKKDKVAERYYRTATEVDPQGVAAHHSLAYYLQNNGKIQEALEIYKKINIMAPSYPDAYLNAGVLYLEQKNYTAAKEQFDILTKVSITDARGFYFKALAMQGLGENEGIRALLQNAVNLDPTFKEAQELLGKVN